MGRGSSLGAETSWRRRTDTTGSPRCPGWIRRLMLVIATSARTGAIMSVAAARTRGSAAGRRSGAGAGDQVTVTDSHHPALRMAPAASSRRQCPRDSASGFRGDDLVPTGSGSPPESTIRNSLQAGHDRRRARSGRAGHNQGRSRRTVRHRSPPPPGHWRP